jgi:hypothetical protein
LFFLSNSFGHQRKKITVVHCSKMSCVAMHQKLGDFHCPRLVSSHFTAYHRASLRSAAKRSFTAQLSCSVSIIVHRLFRPSTDPFSSCKRRKSRRLPQKIDFFFLNSLLYSTLLVSSLLRSGVPPRPGAHQNVEGDFSRFLRSSKNESNRPYQQCVFNSAEERRARSVFSNVKVEVTTRNT